VPRAGCTVARAVVYRPSIVFRLRHGYGGQVRLRHGFRLRQGYVGQDGGQVRFRLARLRP
jgi:hypothetical protein